MPPAPAQQNQRLLVLAQGQLVHQGKMRNLPQQVQALHRTKNQLLAQGQAHQMKIRQQREQVLEHQMKTRQQQMLVRGPHQIHQMPELERVQQELLRN